MRKCWLLLAAAMLSAACAGVASPASGTGTEKSTGMAALAEALVARLPQDRLYRAAGFFGPVVKKYQPVLLAFQREYEAARTSSAKAAVIVKYAPKVDAALADAKAMRVPRRFEKEKADYIRIAEVFAFSLRSLVRLGR